MDQFAEQLANLAELSDEELAALESQVVEAFDAADAEGDVAAMEQLANALDAVRQEATSRAGGEAAPAEAAPPAQMAASGDESLEDTTPPAEDEGQKGEPGAPPAEPTEPSPTPDEGGGVEAPPAEPAPAPPEEAPAPEPPAEEVPAEAGTESTEGAPSEEDTVGDARVTRENVPAGHEPQLDAVAASPGYVIRAGGDIPGVTAGSELATMDDVVDAMTRKVNTMRGVSGDGEYIVVASFRNEDEVPDSRTLRPGDMEGNSRKIRELISDPEQLTPAALTAAGWCAPRAPIYDVPTIGTTSRPIRDALPSFTASRGGVTWMTPPGISSANAAMSRWEWDGEAWVPYAGPLGTTAPVAGEDGVPEDYVTGTKPCVDIPCGEEQTADLIALPICLCFDNLVSRAFPEWIRANTDLTLVAQARFAEQYLMAKMWSAAPIGATTTGGTIGDADIQVGVARDVLVNVRLTASQFRWRNRLDPTAPMQWLAPSWLLDAMVSDLQLQIPGDQALDTSYAEVTGYLQAANISPIWYIDDVPPIAAGATGPPVLQPQPAVAATSNFDSYLGYGAEAEWLLFPTGAFVRLDGGSLDLGVVRTKDDVTRNKYCEFSETFETVAYMGPADEDGWVIRGRTPVSIIGGYASGINTATGVVVE